MSSSTDRTDRASASPNPLSSHASHGSLNASQDQEQRKISGSGSSRSPAGADGREARKGSDRGSSSRGSSFEATRSGLASRTGSLSHAVLYSSSSNAIGAFGPSAASANGLPAGSPRFISVSEVVDQRRRGETSDAAMETPHSGAAYGRAAAPAKDRGGASSSAPPHRDKSHTKKDRTQPEFQNSVVRASRSRTAASSAGPQGHTMPDRRRDPYELSRGSSGPRRASLREASLRSSDRDAFSNASPRSVSVGGTCSRKESGTARRRHSSGNQLPAVQAQTPSSKPPLGSEPRRRHRVDREDATNGSFSYRSGGSVHSARHGATNMHPDSRSRRNAGSESIRDPLSQGRHQLLERPLSSRGSAAPSSHSSRSRSSDGRHSLNSRPHSDPEAGRLSETDTRSSTRSSRRLHAEGRGYGAPFYDDDHRGGGGGYRGRYDSDYETYHSHTDGWDSRASPKKWKKLQKARAKAQKRAEKTSDPWLAEDIPLSFVMSYFKKQAYRSNLLREFVFFCIVTIMFCFFAEYHSSFIERGFFAAMGFRQQYGRQEFPTPGRQVDAFRQEEENGFDLWLRLDSYFHDVISPTGYLEFIHDVMIGSGNPTPQVANESNSGSAAEGADAESLGGVHWRSQSSIQAFGVTSGSVWVSSQETDTTSTNEEALTRRRQALAHRAQIFCGGLRMRTIRMRKGTASLQGSLYRDYVTEKGLRLSLPRDAYARGHREADEDKEQLCPDMFHPFPQRVPRNPKDGEGHTLLYQYVPCDTLPYRAGSIKGFAGNYHCGGHTVDIPFSYSVADAQRVVDAMAAPSCRFLDGQATRLAITEFFVYVPSSDQWLSVKFRSEVSAAGSFDNVLTIRVFQVYTAVMMKGKLIYACFTLAVVLAYLAAIVYKVVRLLGPRGPVVSRAFVHGASGRGGWAPILSYLLTPWPYLDVAFCASAAVSFGYFFRWVVVCERELGVLRGALAGRQENTYGGEYPVVLDEVQRLYERTSVAAAIAVAVLFTRAIYFWHFFSVTRALMIDMVAQSAARLAAIALGYIFALLTYALAGWAVFGPSTEAFSTIGESMATLLQIFTGEDSFVPSALVEGVTHGDAQVNEQFAFFYFWSYFALVYSITVGLALSLTSLTYQELTQKTFVISNDMAYFAREFKLWRARMSWSSVKLFLAHLVGLRDAVSLNEELVACLRRTRTERQMQRIATVVEIKLEQLRAEAALTAPTQAVPDRQADRSGEFNSAVEAVMNLYLGPQTGHQNEKQGSKAGPIGAGSRLETLFTTSLAPYEASLRERARRGRGRPQTRGSDAHPANSSQAAERFMDNIATLLYGEQSSLGEAAARSAEGSEAPTVAAAVPGGSRLSRSDSQAEGSPPALDPADLHRLLDGHLTAEELHMIITADMMCKARARKPRRGHTTTPTTSTPTGAPRDTDSDSDADDVLLPDEHGPLNYFTLTDLVPSHLFVACGGEPFFILTWIDIVADYAEAMSTTAAMEKQVFMQAVGAVTQAKVGRQLERVEQLDATVTQLEGHMSSMIANVQAFSVAMAATAKAAEAYE